MRPFNCDPKLGLVDSDKCCPYCKQYHLRPGYCQALDPGNRDKYPEVTKIVTDNGVTDKPFHPPRG